MNKFKKIYKKIITESYIDDDNAIDNKIYDLLKTDIEQFIGDIKQGEGWIAKEEILDQFLNYSPDWDCQLINLNKVEELLTEQLSTSGIPMKKYDEIQEYK